MRDGDVVVARIGATTGKAYLVKDCPPNAVFASYLIRLRPHRDLLDPGFLAHFMSSDDYWEHINKHKDDRLKGGVNIPVLSALTIPTPGIAEQKIIAQALDLITSAIVVETNAAHTALALKHATMKRLFTSGLRGETLKDTDIGPLPESWVVEEIGRVARRVQYGLSVRGEASGRTPILRMNCQDDGKVVMRDLQFVDLDNNLEEDFVLQPGDILFNRTNSIEHVGRTALFDHDVRAVFASYLIRVTVDADICDPRFLNYFMNDPRTQHEIKTLASRAVGQANINGTKLKGVRFPRAPIDEQREIVAILDAIDRTITLYKEKRIVLEALYKSLLQKLMTGEVRVDDLNLDALASPKPEAA